MDGKKAFLESVSKTLGATKIPVNGLEAKMAYGSSITPVRKVVDDGIRWYSELAESGKLEEDKDTVVEWLKRERLQPEDVAELDTREIKDEIGISVSIRSISRLRNFCKDLMNKQ